MEDTTLPIEGVIKLGNELITNINQHPGVIHQNELTKKGSKKQAQEPMEVDNGNLLEQINKANRYVSEIDDSIKKIYKSVKRVYYRRFPELKLADPMQYILTAQLLGNRPERITEDSIKDQLREVLEPKMHLFISMTAATTVGIKLEPEVMDDTMKACAIALHLNHLRNRLLTFVESNMTIIAPNLSVIVGAPIAAKLMGLAGGLMQLATMPACNLPTLGSHHTSRIETSSDVSSRLGLIYDCDIIQQIPFDYEKDVRKKAVRWVANKCVLAARCDLNKSDQTGEAGKLLRSKIEAHINKELEPPPKKAPRPLPAPIEKSGKRRAGRRVRRMRERYAQTSLRRAVNRINFGDVADDKFRGESSDSE